MTRLGRIKVDIVNVDPDDAKAKYKVDTGYEPRVITIAYDDTEEVTVYEEATDLAYCIERIAASG